MSIELNVDENDDVHIGDLLPAHYRTWSRPPGRFREEWEPLVRCGYQARELSAQWGQPADVCDAVDQGSLIVGRGDGGDCGHQDCWSVSFEPR